MKHFGDDFTPKSFKFLLLAALVNLERGEDDPHDVALALHHAISMFFDADVSPDPSVQTFVEKFCGGLIRGASDTYLRFRTQSTEVQVEHMITISRCLSRASQSMLAAVESIQPKIPYDKDRLCCDGPCDACDEPSSPFIPKN